MTRMAMTDIERWKEIPDFPGYSVSSHGRVVNDETGREMAITQNQGGVTMVGLTKGLKQYRRSVTLLVADAFLDPLETPTTFDTPIQLDGDRWNNRVDNLMWRPRAFAVKYHRQFEREPFVPVPIYEEATGEEFPTSREAAVKYGLLETEIFRALRNKTYVWPTYQIFHLV